MVGAYEPKEKEEEKEHDPCYQGFVQKQWLVETLSEKTVYSLRSGMRPQNPGKFFMWGVGPLGKDLR